MGRSDEHMVLITSVEYDRSNGYCDTLSGTYAIRAVNTDKLEVMSHYSKAAYVGDITIVYF